jgi:hypothetical protein
MLGYIQTIRILGYYIIKGKFEMFEILQDPAVWFWGICSILVMVYYRGNYIYSLVVTALATGLWEIPFFLARPSIDIYFWMLCYHAVPFIVYIFVGGIKINPLREWKWIIVWFINGAICYGLFYMNPMFWEFVGTWYTVSYYLTYIPRVITMVMLVKVLKPTFDASRTDA